MSLSDEYLATLDDWIKSDQLRWHILSVAAKLNLPKWCLAAGFVRNLVWDKLHGYTNATPLNDIDLIYLDTDNTNPDKDAALECQLKNCLNIPWSVKNQARMHNRNGHRPYKSIEDAMSFWPELETMFGVCLDDENSLKLISPIKLDYLWQRKITYNPKSCLKDFKGRVRSKEWLKIWPNLSFATGL